MCNININILNKIRDVNKKYKGKYIYIYSVIFGYPLGFGYHPFGFGYSISPKSIPVRVFCYFGSDFGSDFSVRVQVSGKMPKVISKD